MKERLFAMILGILCLAGCTSTEVRLPLEDVGMVGIIAFDYIDENSMKLTVAVPQYLPEVKEPTQIFSVTTELVSNGIMEIGTLSDKKIVLNQLRVVLINEDFARNGNVLKIIRHLYRNPEVGNKVLVAVVKEKGEDLLRGEYPDKANINFYLNDLLQPSINSAFNPNTNLHDFIYSQTNPVLETIVPLLEKKEEKIEIDGIALFKGKNMIKALPKGEALIIQALQGRKKLAPLPLTLHQNDEEEKLMLDLIDSKVKIKSNKSLESPVVSISLKIKGTLIEFKGKRENSIHSSKDIAGVEKDVNKQLEKDIKEFLDKLKEIEADPIGLTENFRMHYNGKWDKELTNQTLEKMKFDIHVETSIVSTGTLK